jgi:hypothetical protein
MGYEIMDATEAIGGIFEAIRGRVPVGEWPKELRAAFVEPTMDLEARYRTELFGKMFPEAGIRATYTMIGGQKVITYELEEGILRQIVFGWGYVTEHVPALEIGERDFPASEARAELWPPAV